DDKGGHLPDDRGRGGFEEGPPVAQQVERAERHFGEHALHDRAPFREVGLAVVATADHPRGVVDVTGERRGPAACATGHALLRPASGDRWSSTCTGRAASRGRGRRLGTLLCT